MPMDNHNCITQKNYECSTEILRNSRLCKGLTTQELIEFQKAACTAVHVYEKGSIVFAEGGRATKLYVLLTGNIGIMKNTISGRRVLITGIEQPGEIFGEIYLFMDKYYQMQGEAMERSVVLELENSIFTEGGGSSSQHHLAGIEEKLRNNLMKIFAMKAFTLSSKVRILSCMSIREKIALYFTEHQDQQGNVMIHQTREEMADYLNVTRPSLSRELGNMVKEGILSINGRQIRIVDQELLDQYL